MYFVKIMKYIENKLMYQSYGGETGWERVILKEIQNEMIGLLKNI